MKFQMIIITIAFLIMNISCSKNNEKPINKEEPTFQEEFGYVKAISGLKLRTEPTKDSRDIALIPYRDIVVLIDKRKDTVTIDNISDVWVKVRWNKKEGWLFNGYLAKKEDELPIGERKTVNNLSGTFAFQGKYIKIINKNTCLMNTDNCEQVRESKYQYFIKDHNLLLGNDLQNIYYKLEIIDENTLQFTEGYGSISCGDNIQPIFIKRIQNDL